MSTFSLAIFNKSKFSVLYSSLSHIHFPRYLPGRRHTQMHAALCSFSCDENVFPQVLSKDCAELYQQNLAACRIKPLIFMISIISELTAHAIPFCTCKMNNRACKQKESPFFLIYKLRFLDMQPVAAKFCSPNYIKFCQNIKKKMIKSTGLNSIFEYIKHSDSSLIFLL